MGLKQSLLSFYDKKYKALLFFSVTILIIAIIILSVNYAKTGDLFQKGVTLKGGLTITIPVEKSYNMQEIEQKLSSKFPKADISVREITEAGSPKAIIIEAADVKSEELIKELPQTGLQVKEGDYSVESMGSSLGARFFQQTIKALIFAFIAMAIVVLFTFRAIVPSMFVILAAFSDITCTLAVTVLLGMKLSTAGIAAFLMLIGYSVDTDILLTTKVLKRKREGGTIFERTIGAMKTGVLMSLTSLVAAFAGYVLSQSDVIKQIMIIITIGLLIDMIMTWFQNASILRWWMEKKHK
ncbi:MAG TPA: hypothetical protein ENF94_01935 [Candidatus Woesearchaeota archaeon]|nr:MAG: hypothetical protein DRJ25_03880 [Candidatus Woesearchaeota archaeon]HDD70902.1 hypothetical protein [Candidatus Woesearchaeota archaeon]